MSTHDVFGVSNSDLLPGKYEGMLLPSFFFCFMAFGVKNYFNLLTFTCM